MRLFLAAIRLPDPRRSRAGRVSEGRCQPVPPSAFSQWSGVPDCQCIQRSNHTALSAYWQNSYCCLIIVHRLPEEGVRLFHYFTPNWATFSTAHPQLRWEFSTAVPPGAGNKLERILPSHKLHQDLRIMTTLAPNPFPKPRLIHTSPMFSTGPQGRTVDLPAHTAPRFSRPLKRAVWTRQFALGCTKTRAVKWSRPRSYRKSAFLYIVHILRIFQIDSNI